MVCVGVTMKHLLPQSNMAFGSDMWAMQLKIIFSVVTVQIDTAFVSERATVAIIFLIMLHQCCWTNMYVKMLELGFYAVNVEMATLHCTTAAQ